MNNLWYTLVPGCYIHMICGNMYTSGKIYLLTTIKFKISGILYMSILLWVYLYCCQAQWKINNLFGDRELLNNDSNEFKAIRTEKKTSTLIEITLIAFLPTEWREQWCSYHENWMKPKFTRVHYAFDNFSCKTKNI